MNDKKERKTKLVTIRITEEEKNVLEYLSDLLGKNLSDTLTKTTQFFLNTGGEVGKDEKKKERKPHQIHVRITESDNASLKARGKELGVSDSAIIREGLRVYERFARNRY